MSQENNPGGIGPRRDLQAAWKISQLRHFLCAAPPPCGQQIVDVAFMPEAPRNNEHRWRCGLTNPFEAEDGVFHVLVNDEGQHSLWPTFIDVPAGWRIVHNSDTRTACLQFVEKHWIDLRPKSLANFMAETASRKQSDSNE
jgi:uncharacterized protein YbdZ (MbtH family)